MFSDRVLRSLVRRGCIVTLKSGEAFRGVLWARDAHVFVLRNAEALGIGEERRAVPVDGEVVILRPDVAYLQFV